MAHSRFGKRLLSLLLLVAFVGVTMIPLGHGQDSQFDEAEGGTASGAGLGAGSFLLTIPYGVAKVAFALGGSIVGGLAYLFSGADEQAAKKVWTTSMYGTYVITPDHLKGNQPVRFLGVPEEEILEPK